MKEHKVEQATLNDININQKTVVYSLREWERCKERFV